MVTFSKSGSCYGLGENYHHVVPEEFPNRPLEHFIKPGHYLVVPGLKQYLC